MQSHDHGMLQMAWLLVGKRSKFGHVTAAGDLAIGTPNTGHTYPQRSLL